MKIITPIWSDPVGWSQWLAKTKFRVLFWVLIHCIFVFIGFYIILNVKIADNFLSLESIKPGIIPIVFIGVFYPSLYLYAIYRLLKIIREKDKNL